MGDKCGDKAGHSKKCTVLALDNRVLLANVSYSLIFNDNFASPLLDSVHSSLVLSKTGPVHCQINEKGRV